MGNVLTPTKTGEKNKDISQLLTTLDTECRNCAPVSPLECIGRCQVYKLKNELRQLRETMDNPDFIKDLFNVLKNQTRFHILQSIVKGKYSVSQIQQELKKNWSHTQSRHNQRRIPATANTSGPCKPSQRRILRNQLRRQINTNALRLSRILQCSALHTANAMKKHC